jgi:hypothetical protein
MLSENTRIPGCKRCGLGPDEAIHRQHPGHQTHPFALTEGEAVAGRLSEARARSAPIEAAARPCRCGHRLSSHDEDPPHICRLSRGSCNCNGFLREREPYVAPTVHEISPEEAERILDARAPGLLASVRAGRAAAAAEQLERGGHAPFEGRRLHELLEFFFAPPATSLGPVELTHVRLEIARALRARLGSSPALEDFVLAPEVL